MDCPRCGTFCSSLDEYCSCGEKLTKPDAAEPSDKPAKKKRKKKRKKRRVPTEDHALQTQHGQHTMGVLGLFLLNMITCGVYGSYWYLMRQPFVDSLESSSKIGRGMPVFLIAASGINLALTLGAVVMEPSVAAGTQLDIVSRLIGLAAGIANLVLAFKVRSALLDHSRRYEPGFEVSGVATFFLNILYLQYKMNRMKVRANIDDIVEEFA